MPVMHAMLGNAAVAALLALLALAVGYIVRSPAVRHILWVLVLLKLVTPPLFHVPLAVLPASWAEPPPYKSEILPPPAARKSEILAAARKSEILAAARKSEIRNPKSERNRNQEKENQKQHEQSFSGFDDSSFEIPSDFGFRISAQRQRCGLSARLGGLSGRAGGFFDSGGELRGQKRPGRRLRGRRSALLRRWASVVRRL